MKKEKLEELKRKMVQEYADSIRNDILSSGAAPDLGIIKAPSEEETAGLSNEEFISEMNSFFSKLSSGIHKMTERAKLVQKLGINFVFDSALGTTLAKYEKELGELNIAEREQFINSVEAETLRQIGEEINNEKNIIS